MDKIEQFKIIFEKFNDKFKMIKDENFENYRSAIYKLFININEKIEEIICLLENEYPNGAFALTRIIYECMVIIKYLNINKEDEKMMINFHKDYLLKRSFLIEKFMLSAFDQKVNYEDYWWAKKDNSKNKIYFGTLRKETKTGKNILYEASCDYLHPGLLAYFDSLDAKSNKERNTINTLYFICISYAVAARILFEEFEINIDNEMIELGKLTETMCFNL